MPIVPVDPLEPEVVNYVVSLRNVRKPHAVIRCETEDEVWDALLAGDFGGGYEVWSPTGMETGQFVPF